MGSDDLLLADDGNFDQVQPQGPVGRLISYLCASLLMLAGPACIALSAVTGEPAWPGVLVVVAIGVVVTILVGGFGAMLWISTSRGKRRAGRLARNGRPATARIVGTTSCTLGEESGTELTLRISGPEVPEFETTHRSRLDTVSSLGEEFAVVVDPSDNLFRIVR
ncbi:hypothetical protein ACQPZF_18085 [Actinosynnema sp. CS-041913]|uniref:hypothetical protein n=1 Tax=Actinosynnema sp. CS-041913 TaxID=3239917 RepID=UPI003D8E1097